jgi:hypothetical protein
VRNCWMALSMRPSFPAAPGLDVENETGEYFVLATVRPALFLLGVCQRGRLNVVFQFLGPTIFVVERYLRDQLVVIAAQSFDPVFEGR